MGKVYQKGTIKVVWIKGGKRIFSKMFTDSGEALEFADDKKNFLIFKLLKEKDMRDFTWELLPYGKYKLYKKLLKLNKSGVLSKILKNNS